MAHYAKAKLTPEQKRAVDWLRELERQVRLVREEIEIDGLDAGTAIAKINLHYNVGEIGEREG